MAKAVTNPGARAVAQPRRWYEALKLQDAADRVELGQAMVDLSKLSMAHLARRLISKQTSEKEKLVIAMAFGPRLAIERRGRPRKAVAGEVVGNENLTELLEGYGVTARTG